jgi:hypothetical protein
MIVVGTRANGERRRRPIPVMHDTFYKSEWMECGDDPQLSPTAFLVEQPPNCNLVPHFHRQNQFQLFVEGSGLIGREELGAVTVHYAGAYTGYGPLLSGPDGIKYFTIRAICESGFTPITEAKEKMVRGPKRHAKSDPVLPLSPAALAALVRTELLLLIETGEDGMGASLTRLPPGARYAAGHVPGSEGQFLFVTSGTLGRGEATLGRWESLFLLTGAAPPALVAGPGGAEVVAMFIPHKDAAYP